MLQLKVALWDKQLLLIILVSLLPVSSRRLAEPLYSPAEWRCDQSGTERNSLPVLSPDRRTRLALSHSPHCRSLSLSVVLLLSYCIVFTLGIPPTPQYHLSSTVLGWTIKLSRVQLECLLWRAGRVSVWLQDVWQDRREDPGGEGNDPDGPGCLLLRLSNKIPQ